MCVYLRGVWVIFIDLSVCVFICLSVFFKKGGEKLKKKLFTFHIVIVLFDLSFVIFNFCGGGRWGRGGEALDLRRKVM